MLADLALNTLVSNGRTTSSDMLWAGVPFITLRGDNWPSLVATSVAEASQVKGMVVESLADLEKRAVQLAENPLLLKALKESLTKKRFSAPLFDSKRWVRNFEVGLQQVWSQYETNPQCHAKDVWVHDAQEVIIISRTDDKNADKAQTGSIKRVQMTVRAIAKRRAEEEQSDELTQEEIVGQKYGNSSKKMRVKNDTKKQESKSCANKQKGGLPEGKQRTKGPTFEKSVFDCL
jgi:hypothetical protein